jgi:hypothetical protein
MAGATQSRTENCPHVLFAVLDWGLGHATRTWPMILSARQSGARVTVASSGASAAWLQSRMTKMVEEENKAGADQGPWSCIEKPGAVITYANGPGTHVKIALQIPAFLVSISSERKWLAALIRTESITHVISDNCYGVHPTHHEIPSALISHQVSPPVPWLLRAATRKQIRHWSSRFGEVWIPDVDRGVLAGRLSNPPFSHPRFIGPLSRFLPHPNPNGLKNQETESGDQNPPLVGMVSGPEPQRSLMENALIQCFERDGRPGLIFSGRPEGVSRRVGRVRVVCHASDSVIKTALLHADCIVCRSGYSSLMDLAVLGLKAVLVPTPGQPEQELLAHHWKKRWGWKTIQQKNLSHYDPGRPTGQTPWTNPSDSGHISLWLHDWLSLDIPVRPKLQS